MVSSFLAALSFIFGIWWKWDDVVKAPGFPELVKWLSQEKLPHADAERFSIAVVHLVDDPQAENEKRLDDALANFSGADSGLGPQNVQILRFDRTIELKGGRAVY